MARESDCNSKVVGQFPVPVGNTAVRVYLDELNAKKKFGVWVTIRDARIQLAYGSMHTLVF